MIFFYFFVRKFNIFLCINSAWRYDTIFITNLIDWLVGCLLCLGFLCWRSKESQTCDEGEEGKHPPSKLVSKLPGSGSSDKNSNSFTNSEISGSKESLQTSIWNYIVHFQDKILDVLSTGILSSPPLRLPCRPRLCWQTHSGTPGSLPDCSQKVSTFHKGRDDETPSLGSSQTGGGSRGWRLRRSGGRSQVSWGADRSQGAPAVL